VNWDEKELINWLKRCVKPTSRLKVGIGDDCTVYRLEKEQFLATTTDTIIDGIDFIASKITPELIGRKALAVSLSDIAAMGVKPAIALISFACSKKTSFRYIKRVYQGVLKLAKQFGVILAGGDTTSYEGRFSITSTVLGFAGYDGIKPITRKGAKPGDAIVITNSLGGSILKKHFSFIPRVAEGFWINKHLHPHSMIDISDGLAIDLSRMLSESRTGAIIYEKAIPISRDALCLSKKTGKLALTHALYDGEDFELLFTIPKNIIHKVQNRHVYGTRLTVIGEIIREKKIFMIKYHGKQEELKIDGYIHSFGKE
jgi:thiamine-monophosphate kinase